MRLKITFLLAFVSCFSFAQNKDQLWLGAGVKRQIAKDLIFSAGTNARIYNDGRLKTLYQEVALKSEHLKWFRPSVEYRVVTSYDKRGSYTNSHRVNVNLDFRKKIEDFKIGTRFRYQGYIGGAFATGSDLDPAYRIKPYVEWSNKSRFTPELSTEFFYDPVPSPVGLRWNRVRYGLTVNFDAKGPNDLSLTYYYGRKFNTGNPYNEHILSLEYSFEWKAPKKHKSATAD